MKYLKEIKAVEKSIEHWNRDILDRYNNGDSTRQLHALIWASDLENVKFGAKDCQLCEDFYAFSSEPCDKCPYNQVWKYPCTHEGMHWNRFALDPCIGTAQDMVKALKVVKDYFYCKELVESFLIAKAKAEKYPYFGRSVNDGTIVLFTADSTGFVIKDPNIYSYLGRERDDWNEDCFVVVEDIF